MNKLVICAVPGVVEDRVFDVGHASEERLIMGNKLSFSFDPVTQLPLNDYFELRLNRADYDKKIFAPGELNLHFAITTVGRPSGSLSARLRSEFVKNECMVDLFGIRNGVEPADASQSDRVFIAKNYYISGISLESSGSGQSCVLKCFSYDCHLTEDKYCDVFTGKKFGEEIFKALLTGKDIKKRPEINFSTKRLLMMAYNSATKHRNGYHGADNNHELGHDTELVQPHLLQYNESLYDFLCRVAYQCGEFLYFEDGRLNLGLPEDTIKFIVTGESDRDLSLDPPPFCSYDDISDDIDSDVENFSSDYLDENEASSGRYYDMDFIMLTGTGSGKSDELRKQDSTAGEWIGLKALSTVFTSDDFLTGVVTSALTAGWDVIYSKCILPGYTDKLYDKK